jgi:hypothetical protein
MVRGRASGARELDGGRVGMSAGGRGETMRSVRRRAIIAISLGIAAFGVTTLGVSGTVIGPAPAFADPSCPDGYACFWKGEGYTGTKALYPPSVCTDGDRCRVFSNGYVQSAKNRYGNRVVRLWFYSGGAEYLATCMNPGGNRPDITFATYWSRGQLGSRCG